MARRAVMDDLLAKVIRALLEGEAEILNSYSRPVAKALGFLADHFHQAVTMQDVASQALVSRSQLYRLFRQEIGLSPLQVLTVLRVEKAKSLLSRRRFSVTEVCWAVGFADLRSFERAFKRWVGCTPKAYRKNVQSEPVPSEEEGRRRPP